MDGPLDWCGGRLLWKGCWPVAGVRLEPGGSHQPLSFNTTERGGWEVGAPAVLAAVVPPANPIPAPGPPAQGCPDPSHQGLQKEGIGSMGYGTEGWGLNRGILIPRQWGAMAGP